MTLYTKSIERDARPEDGHRICIMRNPNGYECRFDEWLPELSPSAALREQVKRGECHWQTFKQTFISELQHRCSVLQYIAHLARNQNVTLLCVEDCPDHCHRSLVVQEISRRFPDLEVTVR